MERRHIIIRRELSLDRVYWIFADIRRLVIGLFGLIGMAGVAFGPIAGKLVDKALPWYTALFAIIGCLVFQAVMVAGGGIHVSAVVISAFGLDAFKQILQLSCVTIAFS